MKKTIAFILGILCVQVALCQTMTVHRKDQTPVVVPMSQIDSITFSISSPSPSLCSDGIKNGDETDVDCGGSCGKCATNKICNVGSDCLSGICTNHLCAAIACNDLVKNGTETDVDCGGSCAKCATNKICNVNSDCLSGICTNHLCRAPSCIDGAQNGDETDIDCGGACIMKCPDAKKCRTGADCLSGVCAGGICRAPTCTDAVRNGAETDIDCGGASCPKCATGKSCSIASDCQSGVCTSHICQAPTCSDLVQNGGETDVDCGGTTSCVRCPNTKKCIVNSDCASGRCSNGVCASLNTIRSTGGVRYWSDGAYALTCKEYRRPASASYQYSGDVGSGVYRISNIAGTPIDVYCDMTTDDGGWMLVAKYADTSSYETLMRCRSSAAYGTAVGDPNSASPWADWRVLSNVTWPIEFAMVLDQFTPSGWENNLAKVTYKVKNRDVMPNYGTIQDLVSGDNLYYRSNTSQVWTDVSNSSSSANNTWRPISASNLDLTVFYGSNLNVRGIYYGDGVPSGTRTWNHRGIMFVR